MHHHTSRRTNDRAPRHGDRWILDDGTVIRWLRSPGASTLRARGSNASHDLLKIADGPEGSAWPGTVAVSALLTFAAAPTRTRHLPTTADSTARRAPRIVRAELRLEPQADAAWKVSARLRSATDTSSYRIADTGDQDTNGNFTPFLLHANTAAAAQAVLATILTRYAVLADTSAHTPIEQLVAAYTQ